MQWWHPLERLGREARRMGAECVVLFSKTNLPLELAVEPDSLTSATGRRSLEMGITDDGPTACWAGPMVAVIPIPEDPP